MYFQQKSKKGKNKVITVHGCRLHADTHECRGDLLEKTSIFGAKLTACEKAWRGVQAGVWA